MNRKKLHVYIVHQCAEIIEGCGANTTIIEEIKEHKILGVYLSKELAEAHRDKLKVILRPFGSFIPHIAVTKHTVRGSQIVLGNIVIL